MCGRYSIEFTDIPEVVGRILDEASRYAQAQNLSLKTMGEMFPGDTVPVLANNKRMVARGFAFRWGLPSPRPGGRTLINTRSETAAQKPLFAQSAQSRRCLFPASAYYEWGNTAEGKVRYSIQPRLDEVCYLAGLYFVGNGSNQHPADVIRCSILTREAAEPIRFIHDRMPLIMPASRVDDWLDVSSSFDSLLSLACTDLVHVPA